MNGIVGTPDGRIALVAGSTSGSGEPGDAHLFRMDLRTRAVTEVAVRGGFLATMDGLLLEGRRLYADLNFPDGHGSTIYAVDLAILNTDMTALRLVHRSGTASRTQARRRWRGTDAGCCGSTASSAATRPHRRSP
jgi:hypothetical protein